MKLAQKSVEVPCAVRRAIFVLVLLLGASIIAAADMSPDEITALLGMMESDDPRSRQAAFDRINDMGSVPECIARALVCSTATPMPNPRGYSPYGPEIDASAVCEPIVKHIEQMRPSLVEALSNEEWSIRAHAALCLGMGCVECAAESLREALVRELAVVEKTGIRGPSIDRSHPFLSSWIAVFEAYASLDPGDAVEFALSLFSTSQRDVRNFLANYTLARISRNGHRPPYTVSDDESWSNVRRDQWIKWWDENKDRPPPEVIRLWLLDPCSQ